MILQNELDFAVVDNVTLSPHYLAEPLCGETLAAVCAPVYLPGKDTLTLAELAGERLLLREQGSGTRSSVEAGFQQAGVPIRPAVESISTAALLSCARAGLGNHAAAPLSGGAGRRTGQPPGTDGGGRQLLPELLSGTPPGQVSHRRHEAGDPGAAGASGGYADIKTARRKCGGRLARLRRRQIPNSGAYCTMPRTGGASSVSLAAMKFSAGTGNGAWIPSCSAGT